MKSRDYIGMIVIILLLILFRYLYIISFKHDYKNTVIATRINTEKMLVSALEREYQNIELMLKFFAKDKVENCNQVADLITTELTEELKKCIKYLGIAEHMYVVSENGQIAGEGISNNKVELSKNDAWYINVKNSASISYATRFDSSNDKNRLIISYPLYNKNNEVLGAVAVEVSETKLKNIVDKYVNGNMSCNVNLIFGNKEIIYMHGEKITNKDGNIRNSYKINDFIKLTAEYKTLESFLGIRYVQPVISLLLVLALGVLIIRVLAGKFIYVKSMGCLILGIMLLEILLNTLLKSSESFIYAENTLEKNSNYLQDMIDYQVNQQVELEMYFNDYVKTQNDNEKIFSYINSLKGETSIISAFIIDSNGNSKVFPNNHLHENQGIVEFIMKNKNEMPLNTIVTKVMEHDKLISYQWDKQLNCITCIYSKLQGEDKILNEWIEEESEKIKKIEGTIDAYGKIYLTDENDEDKFVGTYFSENLIQDKQSGEFKIKLNGQTYIIAYFTKPNGKLSINAYIYKSNFEFEISSIAMLIVIIATFIFFNRRRNSYENEIQNYDSEKNIYEDIEKMKKAEN